MKCELKVFYHRAFDVGILLKGVDGLLELIAGMTLWLTPQSALVGGVRWLARQELIEDPGDPVANFLLHFVQGLPVGSRHFAAAYLLGHGLVKLGLVAGLWRGARWAYPTAIVTLTAFIGYQSYRWIQQPSAFLAALTVFDVFIVLLITVEWRSRQVLA
ncbi:DUF2127 domain-containing protein [Rhodanobacter sp. AS-Z3]|uniref:DUF2127 domain-containing protein n=1 Tax=Rhodanobacter sp. AS-Z3 TaxID=3031330 RepID=UPI00247A9FB4|nr:DUF2127 domain-containing protein [Rhodanobacter sp. AS-Z3]WEN16520.1 DUF2127 domain-containing protein [Rhodanobacter sp. AS-Z3]